MLKPGQIVRIERKENWMSGYLVEDLVGQKFEIKRFLDNGQVWGEILGGRYAGQCTSLRPETVTAMCLTE